MQAPLPYSSDPTRVGTTPSPGAFRDESASVSATGLSYIPPSRDVLPHVLPAVPTPESGYGQSGSPRAPVPAHAPMPDGGGTRPLAPAQSLAESPTPKPCNPLVDAPRAGTHPSDCFDGSKWFVTLRSPMTARAVPEPPVAEFTPIVPAFPVTETIPAVPVRPIVPTPPVAETIPAAPVRSTIPISPVIETAPAARAFPMTEAIPTVLILPVTETVSSAPVHPIVSMSPAVETVAILPDVPREEATDRSDDESPQSVQGDVSEAPAETPLAGLSDMTSFPDPDAMSAPPFMRAKEGEIEDLTVPQRRPSGRKNAVPRVFPKFVSVFGSRDEADTCLRRFEVPLGGWGAYFPLKLVSDTLGLSPTIVERTMRRITRESGLDVFLNVHDIAILEPKSSVMIGMMTPKGLKEHFGSRNRILVDAFACFLAIPELMEAKKRADAQKAARYRRATEAVDDSDDWDDQDDGDDE